MSRVVAPGGVSMTAWKDKQKSSGVSGNEYHLGIT